MQLSPSLRTLNLTIPELNMVFCLFFLLLLTGDVSTEENCSYESVFQHVGLTYNNKLFYMTRPVKFHKTVTEVHLDLLLYAILEMKEKDQIFVPYVWITMWWKNEYISWDPDQFCGISYVSVPTEIMWKPDITIEEMTERDKAPPSPYITVTHKGNVEVTNDQVLVSTCRMHVYKFPFDTQSCTLTFKSFIHSDEEIKLVYYSNSTEVTEESREVMRTQSEWIFLNMTVKTENVNYYVFNQSRVIYTITMKRRSALYIVNFLLPIFFLLLLDMASFMISDRGGEKLSFKVTVLLAVTVMQLILNEILPSSSNRIPLIAVYCIGVFTLMMVSLLETVLMMFLMERDSTAEDNETDGVLHLKEGEQDGAKCKEGLNKLIKPRRSFLVSPVEMASEFQTMAQETKSSSPKREPQACERATHELRSVIKTLTLLLSSRNKVEQPGYWAKATKKINKIFFCFYIVAVTTFLVYMFFEWTQL